MTKPPTPGTEHLHRWSGLVSRSLQAGGAIIGPHALGIIQDVEGQLSLPVFIADIIGCFRLHSMCFLPLALLDDHSPFVFQVQAVVRLFVSGFRFGKKDFAEGLRLGKEKIWSMEHALCLALQESGTWQNWESCFFYST